MDRFIEYKSVVLADDDVSLKSNMDRFIETSYLKKKMVEISLKSNMDRFIVLKDAISLPYVPFKIQYG